MIYLSFKYFFSLINTMYYRNVLKSIVNLKTTNVFNTMKSPALHICHIILKFDIKTFCAIKTDTGINFYKSGNAIFFFSKMKFNLYKKKMLRFYNFLIYVCNLNSYSRNKK